MIMGSHNSDVERGFMPTLERRGVNFLVRRASVSLPSKSQVWKRRFASVLLILLSSLAALLLFLAWTVADISRHLPKIYALADTHLSKATRFLSSDGVCLATLQTRDQRPIRLDAISPFVIDATIAVEDERFYQHSGVDNRGVLRALWTNLRQGNAHGQGGSTLTQQLARNLYLSSEKTYRRKIAEMLIARRIEQKYSKRDILEAYLNTVYYGSGNYGIEAAARNYLGKSARDLTARRGRASCWTSAASHRVQPELASSRSPGTPPGSAESPAGDGQNHPRAAVPGPERKAAHSAGARPEHGSVESALFRL